MPLALQDGLQHTVTVTAQDTGGGPGTDLTNGGQSMQCSGATASASVQGCTLSGGACQVYLTYTSSSTNQNKVDIQQVAPNSAVTNYLGQAKSAILGLTANMAGQYTYKIYDYNKAFAPSSLLLTSNGTIYNPPSILCNNAQSCAVNAGSNVSITWSCGGTDTLSSGNFMTGGAVSGSKTLTPQETLSYTLQCSPSGSSASVPVTVLQPIMTLTTTPEFVRKNGTSTVSWSTQNVNSCVLTGPSISVSALSGSRVAGGINGQTTFKLTCQTGLGATSTSKSINLVPVLKEN
jgi:hypothetical protein